MSDEKNGPTPEQQARMADSMKRRMDAAILFTSVYGGSSSGAAPQQDRAFLDGTDDFDSARRGRAPHRRIA